MALRMNAAAVVLPSSRGCPGFMPKGFQHLLQHPTAKKRCTSIVSLAERKESKEEKEDEPLKTENSEGRGDRSKLEPAVNEDPDFDDLELTPDLYQELGIDEDELEDDLAFRADDLDPLGVDLDWTDADGAERLLEGISFEADPNNYRRSYGPPCILCAGMRLGEPAQIRALLDSFGLTDVKVIPAAGRILSMTAEEAANSPEPDWEQPATGDIQAGGWGSQRAILLSGLSHQERVTILTVIEGWGLPSLCVAELTPSNASEVLGRVLAEAVQTQRVALRAAAALEHPMLDSEDKLPGLEGVGSAEDLAKRVPRRKDGGQGAAAKGDGPSSAEPTDQNADKEVRGNGKRSVTVEIKGPDGTVVQAVTAPDAPRDGAPGKPYGPEMPLESIGEAEEGGKRVRKGDDLSASLANAALSSVLLGGGGAQGREGAET